MEEEIKKAIGWFSALNTGSEYGETNKEIILNELDRLQKENELAKETIKKHCSDMDNINNILAKLQKENKELKKSINTLMNKRKKWKNRYYKLKKENKKLISDNLEYQRIQDIFDIC